MNTEPCGAPDLARPRPTTRQDAAEGFAGTRIGWVGDDAAVPVVLSLDVHRRESGRQGAAGHDVFGPDALLLVVEVDRVAAAHVDRADAQANSAVVDPVEVHQPLERRGGTVGFFLGRGRGHGPI